MKGSEGAKEEGKRKWGVKRQNREVQKYKKKKKQDGRMVEMGQEGVRVDNKKESGWGRAGGIKKEGAENKKNGPKNKKPEYQNE